MFLPNLNHCGIEGSKIFTSFFTDPIRIPQKFITFAFNMTYYNKVKVNWSPARHINEAWDAEEINDLGLYFITRHYVRNGKEWKSPLYVGITTRSFYKRLKEHLNDNTKWTQAYGRKYISFGTISIYRLDKYNLLDLLTEIETEIIQDLEKDYPNELINSSQKKYHNDKYNLHIEHVNNSWLENY